MAGAGVAAHPSEVGGESGGIACVAPLLRCPRILQGGDEAGRVDSRLVGDHRRHQHGEAVQVVVAADLSAGAVPGQAQGPVSGS